MKRLQKTIGGILIAGILTTGVSSAAFAADTTTAAVNQQQHKMGRGGNLFSVDTLQEKISALSTEQQTEILALAEQLSSYQPEKTEKELDFTDWQDTFSQIKEIFAQANITLPDLMEKKERPSDMKDTDTKPELPADTDGEKPAIPERSADFKGERPKKSADGKRENPFITTINEYLTQLDESNQAAVTALLQQMETEQAERMAERASGTDNDTRETAQALRQQLMQLLEDSGITIEWPALPEKSADTTEEA